MKWRENAAESVWQVCLKGMDALSDPALVSGIRSIWCILQLEWVLEEFGVEPFNSAVRRAPQQQQQCNLDSFPWDVSV